MGEHSAIAWTNHTFNPWVGCTKVSPGCTHCYAERDMGRRLGVPWGDGQPRRRTKESTWNDPKRWDRAAAKAGRRDRVFCASLADVFDPEVDPQWRNDLFVLIEATPNLDWLLLTKRPGLVLEQLEAIKRHWLCDGLPGLRRGNVWVGTTVEDQQRADERIPQLLAIPAAVRFLSCEPLLGPVVIPQHYLQWSGSAAGGWYRGKIDWIIVGGESGPKARPMHPAWARSLRDQARAANVPFFFKQWGEWITTPPTPTELTRPRDLTPGPPHWPTWHGDAYGSSIGFDPPELILRNVGKHVAGDRLDDELIQAIPTPIPARVAQESTP